MKLQTNKNNIKKCIQQKGDFTFKAGRQLFDENFATAIFNNKKSQGKVMENRVEPI